MASRYRVFVAFALLVLAVHPSFAAAPQNQVDLNNCQKAVKAEGLKFVKGTIAAVAACLQKIATEQLRNNASIDNAAAKTCVNQFRKLLNTQTAGKSLIDKLTLKIKQKCDKAFNPELLININDITGDAPPTPAVPQPIFANRLDTLCPMFGGSGINSVQDWIDCIAAAEQCEADQAIAVQFPRSAEWLRKVQLIIPGLPEPTNDPHKNDDAQLAIKAVRDAIDSNHDDIPDITCPLATAPGSCNTACCYIEQSNGPFRPTSCFEYKGTPGEVATFKSNCGAATSGPVAGFYMFTAADGTCTAGPSFGVACVVGSGTNAVAIPTDSSCP